MPMIVTDNQNYIDIAAAIRRKNGEETKYFPNEMAGAVDALSNLNFTVVGGTVQPENPKENTIWVNTDQDITGHVFSAIEPENPAEGVVWVVLGGSIGIEVDAISDENNIVTIKITGASQYLSGAWVSKSVQVYVNSEWKNTNIYLYHYGDECTDITGGWVSKALGLNSSYPTGTNLTVTRYDDHIEAKQTGSGACGVLYCLKKINLSGASMIHFTGHSAKQLNQGQFCIWTDFGSYVESNLVFSSSLALDVITEYDFPIDNLNGEYVIGFRVYNTNRTAVMYDMYLY